MRKALVLLLCVLSPVPGALATPAPIPEEKNEAEENEYQRPLLEKPDVPEDYGVWPLGYKASCAANERTVLDISFRARIVQGSKAEIVEIFRASEEPMYLSYYLTAAADEVPDFKYVYVPEDKHWIKFDTSKLEDLEEMAARVGIMLQRERFGVNIGRLSESCNAMKEGARKFYKDLFNK